MGKKASTGRLVIYGLRIAFTIMVWLVGLAIAHDLIHQHAQLINQLLDRPAARTVAAIFAISLVLYLFIWSLPNMHRPGWRGLLLITAWSSLIVMGHAISHLGEHNAENTLHQLNQMMGLGGFILLACSYSLFLAIPFVAGVEIGLLIMAIFGVPGVIVAYLSTIIGLNLAFGVGRMLPETWVRTWLSRMGLSDSGDNIDTLLERIISGKTRVNRIAQALLRMRYLTLAVCLNFPGNSIIGGGGGLSVLSGLSKRLVYWPYFLVVTIVATLPVPLMVMFGILSVNGAPEHSGNLHALLTMIYGWFF